MPGSVGLLPTDPEHIADYRLLGRLGAGGQGVVYLAEDVSGRQVAVKQLLSGLPELQDESARRRLAKEVAAAQRVAPFCTAQILDADVTGPTPYIVSEYIEGPTLQQHVREHGPISGSALQWLAIGTATALAAIHQAGVVHRDFKPANVLLAADGPRVIDFGIARDLSTDVTVTSRIMGTPAYMAPEQVRDEDVGPATDLFAWASVVAFAATGKAPFEAPHMLAVVQRIAHEEPDLAGVPDDLVPVLRRCLNKDPNERPSAQEVLAPLLGRPGASPAEAAGLVHRAVAVTPAAPAQPANPAQTTPTTQTATITLDQPAPPVTQAIAAPPPTAEPYRGTPYRPGRQGNGGNGGNRGNRGLLALAAGVLVVVLVIGFGMWLWGRLTDLGGTVRDNAHLPSISTGGDPTPTAAPPTEAEKAPAPTPSRAPATSVPSSLNGDWQGTGYQPIADTRRWTARVELETGARRGTVEFVNLGCSGTLTVTKSSDRQVTTAARIDRDPGDRCASSGTLELTALAFGRATMLWKDDGNFLKLASGVLTRQ